MKNRWVLTEETKNKYEPIIKAWLLKIKDMTEDEIEAVPNETFNLDLSDTALNPYILWKLLEGMGYEKTEANDNGWELDFWIYFNKQNAMDDSITDQICAHGCGMTFDLELSISEFM